ncbi:MAG: hypothetical protein GY851_15615, partial [bacterium]|nr:hypothetical protein [bacterium]
MKKYVHVLPGWVSEVRASMSNHLPPAPGKQPKKAPRDATATRSAVATVATKQTGKVETLQMERDRALALLDSCKKQLQTMTAELEKARLQNSRCAQEKAGWTREIEALRDLLRLTTEEEETLRSERVALQNSVDRGIAAARAEQEEAGART